MADLLQQLAQQALAHSQLDNAVQLLLQASSQQPLNPNVWFTLATALARKGGQQTMCCISYLRTLQLLLADVADQQGPASVAMASVASDNCWLLAEKLLPTAWPAALQDSSLNSSMCWGLMHHLSTILQPQQQPQSTTAAANAGDATDSDQRHVQLVCVGGMGVQAMQLAAVASEAQSKAAQAAEAAAAAAGSSAAYGSVPSMCVAYVPDSQLTAHVASQLLLDNELDDIVDICTWPEFMQQQRDQEPPTAVLALLAGAVQPNWGPAISACMQACHRLAAFTSTSYSKIGSSMASLLCPAQIRVWAVPVMCKELLELNEVDLQGIAEHTAGRYNYAAANSRLRRSSRSAQVSRHFPGLLSAPAVVLEVSLQDILQELQQRYQGKLQRQRSDAAAEGAAVAAAAAAAAGAPAEPQQQVCPVAVALAASRTAEASTTVTVQQAGRVDCLVWWLEFEWSHGHVWTAFAPTTSSATAGMLQPHVWQHVQYLQPGDSGLQPADSAQVQQQGLLVHQGQLVEAGQQLVLHVSATAADLQLTGALAAADGMENSAAQDQQPLRQQQQGGVGSNDPSCDILPYHLSMLNDHARTVAYDKGIAGAVRGLLQRSQAQQQRQQQGQGVQASMQQLSLDSAPAAAAAAAGGPVVLDVGCGTGLLSMMAATAAASAGGSLHITGCEREPALAATAQQLVADNSLQQHIKVVQKLSNQLTIAPSTAQQKQASPAATKSTGPAAATAGGGKCNSKQQADLPRKADLIVHEIFGTDPLSEHVLPALQQVQQQLAAPGAVFMPGKVRVIAAVASCQSLLQHVRTTEILRTSLSGTLQPPGASAAAAAGSAAATAAAAGGGHSLPCQMPDWDVSSLLPLQPRKLELQLGDLQDHLLLLTKPQSVLEFDFQQPMKLTGKQAVRLHGLESALLLRDWLQQQQQGEGKYACSSSDSSKSAGSAAAAADSAAVQQVAAGVSTAGQQDGSTGLDRQGLVVVSWFEADCGEGGWLSTAPGNTQLGHWQQSVEFVGSGVTRELERSAGGGDKVAEGNEGSFDLQVSWNHDRVSFALRD